MLSFERPLVSTAAVLAVPLKLKYWCIKATAMLPSPTLAEQRLTEPDLTSPAANTPGWLVSSMKGSRSSVQREELATARPVRTNPLSSVSIASGSQSVHGTAPMNKKTAGVEMVRLDCVMSVLD